MERGPVPPHEEVAASLRAMLRGMKPGEALPSMSDLADRYDVSRATVQKALRALRAEGLITSRQGWGVFKA